MRDKGLCRLLLAVLCALSFSAYAQQVFCPDGLTLVNLGITPKQFIVACGQPTRIVRKKAQLSRATDYTVWSYRFPALHSLHHNAEWIFIAFVFHNSKLAAMRNLQKQGRAGLLSTCQCRSVPVRLGMTMPEVLRACGQPLSQRHMGRQSKPDLKKNAQVFVYHTRNYLPTKAYLFQQQQHTYHLIYSENLGAQA